MRNFTRKQIRDFEKVRKETIKKLELFEAGVKFTGEHYIVTRYQCTVINNFNTEWLDELKSAINNINLKNNEVCGIKIKDNKSKAKALQKYESEINAVIYRQFRKYRKAHKQIDDIVLKDLKKQIEYLLYNSILIGLEKEIKTSYFPYGEYLEEG